MTPRCRQIGLRRRRAQSHERSRDRQAKVQREILGLVEPPCTQSAAVERYWNCHIASVEHFVSVLLQEGTKWRRK